MHKECLMESGFESGTLRLRSEDYHRATVSLSNGINSDCTVFSTKTDTEDLLTQSFLIFSLLFTYTNSTSSNRYKCAVSAGDFYIIAAPEMFAFWRVKFSDRQSRLIKF
ncbi:hypothetical protein AVEN_42181-1 [Araneus ventricosus]|uniref:Uncharacterized protein n=1 Tax=Araneus ventricosus TaxID=182803 RepID=A0A4Y2B0D9_ARAVE|nr:hypothetical protein AVEN_42181-1 [Araneus ventricosus]